MVLKYVLRRILSLHLCHRIALIICVDGINNTQIYPDIILDD